MKIISLNCYGGVVFEPLMEFVKKHAADTDIFCFQEVLRAGSSDVPQESNQARTHLYQDFIKALPDHIERYSAMQEGFDVKALVDHDVQYGLAIFTKKDIEITSSGDFFIFGHLNSLVGQDYSTLGCLAQYIHFKKNDTPYTIVNVHGTSEPAHKRDTDDRLQQTTQILSFLEKYPGNHVVMGDFNLFPDTESIGRFVEAGYRNLILEHEIQTTRGSKMRELHPQYEHGPYGFQEFADYTFVTPTIQVTSFEVPDEPISDHLPMILTFNA